MALNGQENNSADNLSTFNIMCILLFRCSLTPLFAVALCSYPLLPHQKYNSINKQKTARCFFKVSTKVTGCREMLSWKFLRLMRADVPRIVTSRSRKATARCDGDKELQQKSRSDKIAAFFQ